MDHRLTPSHLTRLRNRFSDRSVLSLYLPVAEAGSPERGSWRLKAESMLREAREGLDAGDKDETRAFENALRPITAAFEAAGTTPPPGTWVLFGAEDGLLLSHHVAAPLSPLVRWGRGVRIAPLVGLAELNQQGAVVLLDAERARLFKVEGGDLQESADLIAPRKLEEISDVGVAKRAARATGVRGQTRKDRAKKAWDEETQRFAQRIRDEVLKAAGDGGFILYGGTHRMSQALAGELEARDGAAEISGLRVEMSEPEVWETIGGALVDVHRARAARALQRVEESVGSGGRGCLGWNDTSRALRDSSVQMLLISNDLVRAEPDRAEDIVGLAMEQGGDVTLIVGEAGERLYSDQDGVAALLRYAPSSPVESVAS